MEDGLDAIARTEIQERWTVFDADGERVGEVSEVHETAFTLETTVGDRWRLTSPMSRAPMTAASG
jgi:hypothetical protein